jgi:hypothetical protein
MGAVIGNHEQDLAAGAILQRRNGKGARPFGALAPMLRLIDKPRHNPWLDENG